MPGCSGAGGAPQGGHDLSSLSCFGWCCYSGMPRKNHLKGHLWLESFRAVVRRTAPPGACRRGRSGRPRQGHQCECPHCQVAFGRDRSGACRQGLHLSGRSAFEARRGTARPSREVTARFISLPDSFGWPNKSPGSTPTSSKHPGASIPPIPHSTLHAPRASFGGQDFYPDLIDKAPVLACHIAWNHPLPEGNKRASWACLLLFLDLNGVGWDPDPPNFDEAEEAVFAVAAHEVDEVWFANWLRDRTSKEPRDSSASKRRVQEARGIHETSE